MSAVQRSLEPPPLTNADGMQTPALENKVKIYKLELSYGPEFGYLNPSRAVEIHTLCQRFKSHLFEQISVQVSKGGPR